MHETISVYNFFLDYIFDVYIYMFKVFTHLFYLLNRMSPYPSPGPGMGTMSPVSGFGTLSSPNYAPR